MGHFWRTALRLHAKLHFQISARTQQGQPTSCHYGARGGASSCSYSRCAEQWRSTKKELSLRATTATGGIASHRPPAPVAVRRGASRLLLAGVGVWLTCDAPLHLAQLNGRHAGPAGWLQAGCWLPCLCNRIPYRCWLETTSTYCTGTDVRGCKQLYAAVPVYSCT